MVYRVQLQHWFWIASYLYVFYWKRYTEMPCPLLYFLEIETVVTAQASLSLMKRTCQTEYLVYQALQQQSSTKIDDIIAIVNKKNVFPIIQS